MRALAFLFFCTAGCGLFTLLEDPGTNGPLPEGQRLITGELQVPREDDFGGAANQGMTLAALIDDPAVSADPLRVGTPFNPSQTSAVGGDRTPFQLILPTDKAAVLFFQTTPAAGSGNRFGLFLAKLSFASGQDTFTARIPPGEESIDLGLVVIEPLTLTTNADNVALPEENPLSQVDTDNDGTDNAADPDDDNDGLPDLEDEFDDNIDNQGLSDAALEAALEALITPE